MTNSGVEQEKEKLKKSKQRKYYNCERCGYLTIISNSYCPICAKDGKNIKMK